MSLLPNLVELMKKAAIEAVEASNPTAVVYGTVTSISPIKINIEQKHPLTEDFLLLTTNVKDYQTKMRIDNSSTINEVTIYNGLKNGDKVILLRIQGGQKYIVLDRM